MKIEMVKVLCGAALAGSVFLFGCGEQKSESEKASEKAGSLLKTATDKSTEAVDAAKTKTDAAVKTATEKADTATKK